MQRVLLIVGGMAWGQMQLARPHSCDCQGLSSACWARWGAGAAVLGASRGGFMLLVPFTEVWAQGSGMVALLFCDLLTGEPLFGNWVSGV